jgi:hypothetical protein
MDLEQSPRLVDHSIDIITITICAAICHADTMYARPGGAGLCEFLSLALRAIREVCS